MKYYDSINHWNYIVAHCRSSKNPVIQYALNLSVENAHDSKGAEVLTADTVDHVEIVKVGNLAWYSVAVSTFFEVTNDIENYTSGQWTRQQMGGGRRKANNLNKAFVVFPRTETPKRFQS